MELSLGGLIGAMIGGALGAVNYAIIAPMVDGKLRSAPATDDRADLENRVAVARRGVLAFNMLVFVGAGYWTGSSFG